jgi:hypothetical protein
VNQPTTFEDRLLAVLEAEVAEASPRSTAGQDRRRRAWQMSSLAGAAALAVAGAVGVPAMIGLGTGSAAWAVETRPDGSVEVSIRDFKDPAGLERRLATAGIPTYVEFIPHGMLCTYRTTSSNTSLDGAVTAGSRYATFKIHAGQLGANERLVVTGVASDGSGRLGATLVGIVQLNEERCDVVPAGPTPGPPPSSGPSSSPHPTATPQR